MLGLDPVPVCDVHQMIDLALEGRDPEVVEDDVGRHLGVFLQPALDFRAASPAVVALAAQQVGCAAQDRCCGPRLLQAWDGVRSISPAGDEDDVGPGGVGDLVQAVDEEWVKIDAVDSVIQDPVEVEEDDLHQTAPHLASSTLRQCFVQKRFPRSRGNPENQIFSVGV